jgi:hypothetical protein
MKEIMKPIQKSTVVNQPPIQQPQALTDEQAVQILNKMRTKGSAAQISIEEILGETSQLFIMLLNQKNSEIRELKEALAKQVIEKKL